MVNQTTITGKIYECFAPIAIHRLRHGVAVIAKNINVVTLASKIQHRRELARRQTLELVQSRMADIAAIEKTRGWQVELSKRWGVTHTTVARFVKKYVPEACSTVSGL